MNENEEFEFRARQEAEANQATANNPEALVDPTSKITQPIDDFFTKSAEQKDFSLKEVAGSALVGAGVGGGIGLAAGGVGAIPGAIAGGIYGAIGNIAGQLTKMGGGSEAAALGAEIAAGGVAAGAKNLAQAGAKAASTWLPWKERVATKVAGLGESAGEVGTKRAVESTFGKKAAVLDYAKQTNQIGTQNLLRQEMAAAGKEIPENMKVSDVLREDMYGIMDSTNPLVRTPQAKTLTQALDTLIERGQATKVEKARILKTFNNQLSKNPDVLKEANRDILNLVQSGGAYKDAEGKIVTKINSAAQDVLKKNFSDYLGKGAGQDVYGTLKQVERAEFVAAARDAIPQILGGGMKPAQIKELGESIASTPEGKAEFAAAFMQHLGGLDVAANASPVALSNTFMKELRKVSPVLLDTKLMTGRQINAIQSTIAALPKTITKEARQELALRIVKASIMSGLGSEAVNKTNQVTEALE